MRTPKLEPIDLRSACLGPDSSRALLTGASSEVASDDELTPKLEDNASEASDEKEMGRSSGEGGGGTRPKLGAYCKLYIGTHFN